MIPGVEGRRIIDCCRCFGPPASVRPMTIAILQRGSIAPDVHHLRPSITYSSPSRRISVRMLVASDEAIGLRHRETGTDRFEKGFSQRSFWSGVP